MLNLYASTREHEMSRIGWPAEAIVQFLAQQFAFQAHHYSQCFPTAQHWLIELRNGTAVGRLTLDWSRDAVRIVDIALLPAYRRHGLGTEILLDLIEHAERHGLAVDLHAQAGSRALNLYRRLGFQEIADHGMHLALRHARGERRLAGAPSQGQG